MKKIKKPLVPLYNGVEEGRRNDLLAKIADRLARDGVSFEDALKLVLAWNKNNNSPMDDKEGERTLHSIYERHQEQNPSKQTLLLLSLAGRYTLFHDQTKQPCAFIEHKVIPIENRAFERKLRVDFLEEKKSPPQTEAIRQILPIIEETALKGDQIKLYNRVGKNMSAFYYDLGGDKVVTVNKKSWETTEITQPLFKNLPHQQVQSEPKGGGNLNMIFDFINVKDEELRLLLKVYLVTCFIPEIPHPILYLRGGQGSGKTFASKIIKSLVDPSAVPVIGLLNEQELIQTLSHHYYVCFDNLSKLPQWASDVLCRACTGEGYQKRKLYTNDESVIYNFRRCILLNGIVDVINRPDLMDRTILMKLGNIDSKNRKPEESLMNEFDKAKPLILGACFNVLSKAMRYGRKQIEHDRLADFYSWGVKIARALGYKEKDFKEAIKKNSLRQNLEIISANTFIRTIIEFMKNQKEWEGTMKELYQSLEASPLENSFDYTFPRHWNKMREPLERFKPVLNSEGIEFTIDEKPREDGVHILLKNKNYTLKKS
jgi:hypothetical protein